ncbi:MAG: hypothetical protein U0T36_07570 [Saprospiraceae bacterium]
MLKKYQQALNTYYMDVKRRWWRYLLLFEVYQSQWHGGAAAAFKSTRNLQKVADGLEDLVYINKN